MKPVPIIKKAKIQREKGTVMESFVLQDQFLRSPHIIEIVVR